MAKCNGLTGLAVKGLRSESECVPLLHVSACQSDALVSMSGLRCLIQGALYNELKDSSAAEKVRDILLLVCCCVTVER